MNLVVPFGFFGAGNIGDESTLQGFARLLSLSGNGTRVWVASRNPGHTARIEPSFRYYGAIGHDLRGCWARYRSDAHAIVGGTPIMDVLGTWPLSELTPLVCAAHKSGKPVVFVGTGTERLQREDSQRLVKNMIAPRVRHWSVRCERDKERLVSNGVSPDRVTVAADLAWLLEPVPGTFGVEYLARFGLRRDDFLVGVNVNNERFVVEQAPRLFEVLGSVLDGLVEQHDARILFFSNEVREDESFDKAASLKVRARMKHGERALMLPNEYWAPQQMLSLIANCSVTLSMRYHFCLFSALQNVPFVAVKRSDKVDDLCWDLNWPYWVALDGMDVTHLVSMCLEINQRRSSLAGFLKESISTMRQRALRNRVALDVLGAYRAESEEVFKARKNMLGIMQKRH